MFAVPIMRARCELYSYSRQTGSIRGVYRAAQSTKRVYDTLSLPVRSAVSPSGIWITPSIRLPFNIVIPTELGSCLIYIPLTPWSYTGCTVP